MTYKFTEVLSEEINQKPVLLSGYESQAFSRVKYLIISAENSEIAYEIRYEYSCSPFQDVKIENNILAVGFEEYFYLFDLNKNKSVLSLKLGGYFGHLYFYDHLFYVADAYGLTCINMAGQILWKTEIAIDGVIVDKIDADKIYGKSEHDPPNGWEDFVLDIKSGKEIKKR